jgi:uncharacterized protein YkwD
MRLVPLCLFLLVLFGLAPNAGAADPSATRRAFLAALNQERSRAGVPPLRLSAPLSSVAQIRAEEIARQGDLREGRGSESRVEKEMTRAGYRAQRWIESEIASDDPLPEVVDYWQRGSAKSYREVMAKDFKEVGIGVAALSGQPLYTFLFAVPEHDYFVERTAGLQDIAAVRRAVLDRVNAERRAARRAPLAPDPRLDQAADRHARDMLARGYFAHESPEGKTVRQRAEAALYKWRAIGENIAEGQLSVDEVMQGWMESPHHRENILSRDFTQMGLGLAMGEGTKGFQVVWVQTFGQPRKGD